MKDKEIIEKVIDEMGFTKRGFKDKRPNWLCDITREDIEEGIKKAMKLKLTQKRENKMKTSVNGNCTNRRKNAKS